MKLKKNSFAKTGIFLLSLFLVFGFTANSVDKKQDRPVERLSKTSSNSQSVGDSYYMFVNDIAMPMNSKGVMADVVIDPYQSQGRINNVAFLYSGGFFLSGVNRNTGIMWTNAMASASRTQDYEPGNAAWDTDNDVQISDDTYSGIFLVRADDEPFGDSWVAWGEAVNGGASFYDGDGDELYNPVDKNGNGEWDPDEDSPDILGDETAWCVYNDAVDPSIRTYTNVEPQGIEVRQTVWAYATAGDLGKIMFIRYSLLNTGLVADVHDSVYFGVWADADIGDALDDLVGSDTTLNAGYTYNDGDDPTIGSTPPAFLIDFFQGPWESSDNPDDFALNTRGPILGVDTIWGANNLPLTSFTHYIQSHPTQGDPDNETQARNFLQGYNQQGEVIDPCNWEFGTVFREDCSTIDPFFIYSGDPVTLQGWIHTDPYDQRQMSNTGYFTLEKDKPVDIVVAYVVGRSTSAIASVKEAKKIDRAAQFVFQNNFNVPKAPPVVEPIVKAYDNRIELIWETYESTQYNEVGVGYDMRFEYFEVTMYNAYSTAEIEGGKINSQLIARYDIQNEVNKVIYENPVSDERTTIYDFNGTQLDSATYFDPDKGRITLNIVRDPFTGGFLEKNKPYFISLVSTALNYDEIEQFDALGTYIIPGTATLGSIANIPLIIDDDKGNTGILTGDSQNEPYYEGVPADHVVGEAESEVSYSVQDKSKTTDHTYEVGFFQDSLSIPYVLYYYIKDLTTGLNLVDSSKDYYFTGGADFNNDPFLPDEYYSRQINNLIDGVTVTVPWVDPGVGETSFEGDQWFLPLDDSTTGGFYVGRDVSAPSILPVTSKTSSAIGVGDLRQVELRFDEDSKAHRYVRRQTGRYPLGDNTGNIDSSFVDVPFAAYEINSDGDDRRLAVGFTETANELDSLRMPDGVYFPGENIEQSKEYIIIFKGSYDETATINLPYFSSQQGRLFADIANGYKMDDPGGLDPAVLDSLKTVANSAWFDAMYVCGFETDQPRDGFNPTGTYTIYPGVFLSDRDKYEYAAQVSMTTDDAQAQWDKVNVFPNPLFGINSGVSYTGGNFDEPYVTFNNLPSRVTIKLYTISGVLLRTLEKDDASSILRWDLQNESELRVASGMYIALISNPEFGDKVLKLAIIMPQKQLQNY